MPALSPEQISFYNENGYVAPIDIFTAEEAALIALRIIPKSLTRSKA